MVTEDSLETLNKELEKLKEEKKDWFSRYSTIEGLSFVILIMLAAAVGCYLGTESKVINGDNLCPVQFSDFNQANMVDRNFFVSGLNALYEVQMQNDSAIYKAIQDINKKVS